jgi:glycosyltransferase involved in cell wall biosynthesis
LKKIIYITYNYDSSKDFPNNPNEGDRFYTYGFGGTLSRQFKQYCPEWEVECWRLAGTKGYTEKTISGVVFKVFPSIHIKSIGHFSLKFLRELRKEVKKTNPILFVTHVHQWILYQITFFFKRKRIVVSSHGEHPPLYIYQSKKGIRKFKAFFELQIEKILLKRARYFFVCDVSEIKILDKLVPKESIYLSRNGINIDQFPCVSKNEARKKLGWDINKKYILYVGVLYKIKQVDELITIWQEIKKTDPKIELVLLGASESDEFYEIAIKSGAIVMGKILKTELYLYYSASDVYVLVSLRNDYFGGIGNAPLESLACNTPVVSKSLMNYLGDNVHELGEIPSTIEEYKSDIIKVLNHPELYKNMRESVEKYYSWKNISKHRETLLLKVNGTKNNDAK